MNAASLSLLKGGNPAAEEVLPPPVGADPEDAEATIDVDLLDNAELDTLVQDYEIQTPEDWKNFDAEAKRDWLKTQFDDGSEEAAAEAPPPAPEPKAAKKPAKTAKPKPEAVATPVAETPAAPEPAATEVAVADPPAPTAASTKVVSTKSAKSGTVTSKGDDVLSDLIHEIETLKEKQARLLVKTLSEETEVAFFRLGGVLSVIQANGWYEPYASFREFVEKEHGLHYRKATYWVGIYNNLAESKVPWEKVADLGWTKLKEIAGVINNDNVDEWVKVAKAQNTLSLIETVKAHLQNNAPKALEDGSSSTVTTKTFKVHEGQKTVIEAALAKAKNDSGTVVDTVALEYICSDFLAAQTTAQKLKAMGIESALEALEKAYPNAKIDVEITEEEGA
jgi:hypothetical protein